jgi:hypothetical protein
LLSLVLILALVSCRDTVIDPFENVNRRFTVYGYLNPLDTLQTVRIIPVSRRNEPLVAAEESFSSIDAEVFSVDLTAFTVNEWTHSLKRFPDNSVGHFFTGNFPVHPGHTYRLIITRVDGATTTAQTTVPNSPAGINVDRSDAYLNPSLGYSQDITISGDAKIWDFQTIYRVIGTGFSAAVIVPFGETNPNVGTGPWTVTLPISQDQSTVAETIAGVRSEDGDAGIALIGMGLLFRIVDDHWASYMDQTDSQLLSRGDHESNVVNGAGFWGSMGLVLHEWGIRPELSEALGYGASPVGVP